MTWLQARSDLAKSDEQWFAQLRLEVERVTRAHMQVRGAHPCSLSCVNRLQEMDQCERRLQDARTARDGDRAEQAAAMAAANTRNVELQKALQQLQVRLNSSQFYGFGILTCVLQEQQRQAERAHDNCRRDLQEQGATIEDLNSEMQARLA